MTTTTTYCIHCGEDLREIGRDEAGLPYYADADDRETCVATPRRRPYWATNEATASNDRGPR